MVESVASSNLKRPLSTLYAREADTQPKPEWLDSALGVGRCPFVPKPEWLDNALGVGRCPFVCAREPDTGGLLSRENTVGYVTSGSCAHQVPCDMRVSVLR
jgi:hypothetical protein